MNRFNTNSNGIDSLQKSLKWIPLIMGILVVIIFSIGINYVSASSLDSQQESLENAIARDVAQCYAIEGAYPGDLEYLVDHYGLTYNDELFFVDYQAIGSNLYPDITIIRLKK